MPRMEEIQGFVYAYWMNGEWHLADDTIFMTIKEAKEQYGHTWEHVENARDTYKIVDITLTEYTMGEQV